MNVSVGTIRNEIKRGRLKVLRFGIEGKAIRIRRDSLLELIEAAQAVPVAVSISLKSER